MTMRMAPCIMMGLFAALIVSSSAATTTKKTTTTKVKTSTTVATGGATTTATTTTVVVTTVSGEIVFTATGLTQTMVEQAGKKAVASHYNVSDTIVSVTVAETRRLNAALRRLGGNWKISYEFIVPPEKAAAVATKVDAATSNAETFKQDFTQVLKEKLTAAGASPDALTSIAVTSITSQSSTPGAATSTSTTTQMGGTTGDLSSNSYQMCTSMVAIALMTLLLSGM